MHLLGSLTLTTSTMDTPGTSLRLPKGCFTSKIKQNWITFTGSICAKHWVKLVNKDNLITNVKGRHIP